MKAIRDFGDTMNWVSKGKRAYELFAGSDVVATLRWEKGFGSPAEGETAEGRFIVERSGLLRPRVLLRDDAAVAVDADAPAPSQRPPLLSLEIDWGGRGVVVSRDGKKVDWNPKNLWRTAWAFEDAQKILVSFETEGAVKFAHRVKVVDRDAPELGAFVLLGSAVGVYLTEDTAIFGI